MMANQLNQILAYAKNFNKKKIYKKHLLFLEEIAGYAT